MKKELLLITLAAAAALKTQAQVEDVSVIVSPTIGYNWFDSKSTVENGLMYGVQAGFGFGKFIELRGVYERSVNLKQRFGQYENEIRDLLNDNTFNFQDRNIKVSRWGGEFKANIQVGGMSPYIILGTGVQTMEREFTDDLAYKNQNIYGTGGLGFKVNMGNRITLNLEGRGLVYNMNPGSLLYNPGQSSEFDNWINNQKRDRMYNWNATAGLQIYLGGRNETGLSEMDKAYLNRFSSGMSGMKVTLAPAAAYVNFSNKSAYRNTYMLGGQLGVDLTDFVGLRAYYYQSTMDEKLSFDFNKMAMYGVDFVGKLNVARGIVPYLTVGGGYINVQDGYLGKSIGTTTFPLFQTATSTYFAKGGVGLDVPLGTYLDVFGAANLMYTAENNNSGISDLRTTDQLRQHTMYNVGLRLKLGRNANTYGATKRAFDDRYAGERYENNQRIKTLEKELKEAYNNNDIERVTQIMEEKKIIETPAAIPQKDSLIRMTPAELESLIDKVIQGVEEESTPNMENRLERLEQLLINMNQGRTSGVDNSAERNYTAISHDASTQNSAVNDRLIAEIAKLNQQLADQQQSIENLRQQPIQQQPILAPAVQDRNVVVNHVTTSTDGNGTVAGVILNKGIGLFLGPNFGDATSLNVGLRSYTGFTNTPIIFMPEAYVALGNTNGFGISANGIIPFRFSSMPNFAPYAGLGLGLNFLGKEVSFNPNFIAGVAQKIGMGSVFADYTVRGAFRNNQLALGYRFRF